MMNLMVCFTLVGVKFWPMPIPHVVNVQKQFEFKADDLSHYLSREIMCSNIVWD